MDGKVENLSGWRQVVGKWGENTAVDYLSQRGYRILERNFRTAHGEIDIIAVRDDVLIFVEVKSRSSRSFGLPEDSITPRKQAHMRSAAEHYLQEHVTQDTWQFDVIAIIGKPFGKVDIQHFENVLE